MSNISQAAELLLENYNTIGVIFPFDNGTFPQFVSPQVIDNSKQSFEANHLTPPPVQNPKVYTYKIPKDLEVKCGDLVVCKANKQIKLVQVVEVHKEPQIEFTGKVSYKWAFQKIDSSILESLESFDKKIQKSIQVLEQRNMKRALLKELAGEMTEEEMKALMSGTLPEAKKIEDLVEETINEKSSDQG